MSPDADDSDWRENPEPDSPSLGPEVPSVDVPEVELPQGGPSDAADASSEELSTDGDSEAVRLFWRLVVVIDVGIAALALGPMFIYFQGDWNRGLLLTVFGLAVLAYGVREYRSYRTEESPLSDDETEPVDEGDAHQSGGDRSDGACADPTAEDPKA